MTAAEFKTILHKLPNQPGIYKYFDERDMLLYVGKAKDLRKRVSSYFTESKNDSARIRLLVKKIKKIDVAIVETETDALLLENSLIKKHQPRYNVALKDDKTYPYVCIKNEHFPRMFMTRKMIPDGSVYLGPFVSISRTQPVLDFIREVFPLRTCNLYLSKKNIEAGKFKSCLEYHIGKCAAPCIGKQTEEDYAKNIQRIRTILRGNLQPVIADWKFAMNEHSSKMEFEAAETYKKKLQAIENYQSKSTIVNPEITDVDVFSFESFEQKAFVNYLKVMNGSIIQTKTVELTHQLDETQEELLIFTINALREELKSDSQEIIVPFEVEYPDATIKVTVPKIGDKKKLLDLSRMNALYFRQQRLKVYVNQKQRSSKQKVLDQLKEDFHLTELPDHIECFDNSNMQGSFPVASMVVFRNGKPAKNDYRHFNIKTVEGPNDFASMEEIVFRRYKRLLDEKKALPKLVMIDGGKGQLSSAMKSIRALDLEGKIAIAGIAKKLEEIYFPNDPVPMHINKKSMSLKLIQQIRNEAHRFAIEFHRDKRSKGTFKTALTEIDGIGKSTAEKLLTHFKSVKKIQRAPFTELAELIGDSKAQVVFDYLTAAGKVEQ